MSNQDSSYKAYVKRMRLRRRQLLKAGAVGGGMGIMAFLAACAPAAAPASPTTAPAAPAAPTATTANAAPTTAAATATTGAAAPTATTAAVAPTAPTAAAAATPTAAAAAATPTTAVAALPNAMAGALKLNLGADTDTIDPGRVSFIDEIEIVMRNYANVYTFDPKAKLVPDQAANMPQVSADGKTITVKLKQGLMWSDGQPLTAKDFVYGAKRQLSPIVAGDYAFTLYALVGAEKYNTADPKATSAADLQKLRDAVGISAPDDTTIVYTLTDDSPWFLSVLATWNALPVRQDLITGGGKNPEDNQDWTDDPKTNVGNGPYIMTLREKGVQFQFASNPKYARGEPPIKNVQYFIIKDNTVAFNAYKAGNIDVMDGRYFGVGPLIKPAVDADPQLTKEFVQTPGACCFYLGFNNTIKPFDNVKVRQAFSAAFDRDTFTKQVMKGLDLTANQFLPPGFPGHYDDIPPHKFDPAGAAKLLADAGFPGGQGLPPIKFTFGNNDTNKLISQAAQAMFKQYLGVSITLDPVEPKAFTALTKKQETVPQLFRLGWCQDYPDPQDWYSTVFQGGATVSHTGWKNANFDKLTKAADVEIDPKKRDDLYRQAAVILNTETPVAFLYWDSANSLVKPRVQGLKLDPFEQFTGQHSLYDMKLGS